LGDQYGRANLGAKAIEYLGKAAVQALDNFANREAIDFFGELSALDEALGYPSSRLRRARWERGLGEGYFRSGNWKDGGQHFKEALVLLNHPVPKTSGTLALGIAKQIIKQGFYRLGASEEKAKMSRQQREALLEAANAYRSLGQVYYYLEERNLFLFAGLYNANLAHHLGRSPELIPLHGLAKSYGRRVVDMLADIEDVPAKSWASFITAYYYLYTSSWPEIDALTEPAAEMAAQIGYRRQWEENNMIRGLGLINPGEFEDSQPYFASVTASAKRRDDAQPQIWGLSGQVEARLWLDDDPQASLVFLEEAKGLLSAGNINVNDHIRVHGLSAVTFLRMGNMQLAREEAQHVLDLATQAGFLIPYAREGYHGAVDVLLSLWEKAETQNARQEYAALTGQVLSYSRRLGRTFPVIAARAWLLQGRYDWLSGKRKKAQKAWRKSSELARELGMPHEEGLVHYEYGRHLQPGDPDREKHLKRALDLFTNVGANYYTNLTREELITTM
jgi:hypothetical protein